MNCKFHVRVSVALDVAAFDTADAWELLNAWADALREGDFEGLKHLDSVSRVRPSFALSDIKQLSKPPAEPEPVHIVDPTVHRLSSASPSAWPLGRSSGTHSPNAPKPAH